MEKHYPLCLIFALSLVFVFIAWGATANGVVATAMQTQEIASIAVEPLPGCGVGYDSACLDCGGKTIPISCRMYGCEWCDNPCDCGFAPVTRSRARSRAR